MNVYSAALFSIVYALNDSRFMEEDGKVFSDYDVDLTTGRTWFEGVKLVVVSPPGPNPLP